MFKAYSQLQPGDGMVLYTKSSGGHAVMVVDVHIEYTGDKIDGGKSYVTIIEQKSSPQRAEECYYDEQLGQMVYICGAMDLEWSFDTIYGKGYLPVTCKELVDPSPKAEEQITTTNPQPSIDNLWMCNITANYRIASITTTILLDGQPVQRATVYGRQRDKYDISMLLFRDPTEAPIANGLLDLDSLPQGQYQCVVTCLLGTGNSHTVYDFTFTK